MAMSREHADRIPVAVFAKAPIPGYAKTRLIPRLGADNTAKLQGLLIERALHAALAADIGPVSLWCTPDSRHEFFRALAAPLRISLHEQTGYSLGARMRNAFDALTIGTSALLIGTDCAVLEPEHLTRCAKCLNDGADAVFVPVEDGGYIAVGLKQNIPALFDDIPWGTPGVMATTEARARAAGANIEKLAPLWDIDRPADFDRALRCGALQPSYFSMSA
ncbi:MAG: TIGR04282 family arsenosugar biosynthesis glycosyltransferase [Alphaproteobacteria bacterium]